MTESNVPRDILGRVIAAGDYIAHAGSLGRDPALRVHRVIAVEPGQYPTLRVELVLGSNEESVRKPGKRSVIQGGNTRARSLIVTGDFVNTCAIVSPLAGA